MRLVVVRHFGTFLARSFVGLAACCGVTFMLNGVALADSVDQSTTVQTESNVTTEVSGSGTVQVEVSTTPAQQPADSVKPATSNRVTSNDPAATEHSLPNAIAVVPETTASETPPPPAHTIAPVSAPPLVQNVPLRAQLANVAGDWVIVASDAVATEVPVAKAIADTAAALPPVNLPVIPSGLLSQFSGQFTGILMPHSPMPVLPLAQGIFAFVALSLVLRFVGSFVTSYGQWLRRVGHVTAARSNVCSLFSSLFATPPLIGFFSVPPPRRGLFFEVAETNGYAN